MLKKTSFFIVACICFAFAQDSYSPAVYATPHAEDNTSEPSLYISVHPISLFILTAIGVPSIFVTIEKTIDLNTSFIARPSFVYLSLESGNETLSALSAGITTGYRIYARKRHRGFYFEPEISFYYVSIDYDNPTNITTGSIMSIAPMIMIGSKFMANKLAVGFDVGVGYAFSKVSASGSTSSDKMEKDLSSATLSGPAIDLNFMVGFGY